MTGHITLYIVDEMTFCPPTVFVDKLYSSVFDLHQPVYYQKCSPCLPCSFVL